MDAYTALKALLPPTPRRGLVLIDPPFEKTDEFDRLVDGLNEAHRRWATRVYAIWYPLKARAPVPPALIQSHEIIRDLTEYTREVPA